MTRPYKGLLTAALNGLDANRTDNPRRPLRGLPGIFVWVYGADKTRLARGKALRRIPCVQINIFILKTNFRSFAEPELFKVCHLFTDLSTNISTKCGYVCVQHDVLALAEGKSGPVYAI